MFSKDSKRTSCSFSHLAQISTILLNSMLFIEILNWNFILEIFKREFQTFKMHKHYIWRLKLLVPGFRKRICFVDPQTNERRCYYSVQFFILLATEAKKEAGHKNIWLCSFLRNFIGFAVCHGIILLMSWRDPVICLKWVLRVSRSCSDDNIGTGKQRWQHFHNAVLGAGGKYGAMLPNRRSLALSQKGPNTNFIFCWLCD